MVIRNVEPEEWYFEIEGEQTKLATAVCCLQFNEEGAGPTAKGYTSEVPESVHRAVEQYDGPYAPDYIRNPSATT